ncbi:MAG: hypothetical protein LBC61_01955 [Candidatus Peribacteria bacterium]|jgi:hypothetical protein|nr:hypothetical protein [Candidatus Peribacteria bacterium]
MFTHFQAQLIQYGLFSITFSIGDFFIISTIWVSIKDFFFFKTLKFTIAQGIAHQVIKITLPSKSGLECFNLAKPCHQNTSFSTKMFSKISFLLSQICGICQRKISNKG